MSSPFESYITSVIRPIHQTTREERLKIIQEVRYNLFKIPSKYVMIDLLTDSGTGGISNQQLAELILGDESYAGSASFEKMKEAVYEVTGFDYLIPTHQGRGAENVLCSTLVKEGDIVPGNSHFDTTKGHIEFRKATAVDCTIDAAREPTTQHPFKGNLDLEKLEEVLRSTPREGIPFVLITVTCNSGGGQPVSLENIRGVAELCKRYGVRLFFDMARFAENAYFIKSREPAFKDWSILKICREMFSQADGATMSAKKDAISAMGGFLALRDEELYQKCSVYSILFEGYLTYGGMTGGTMGVVAQGLREVTDEEYLRTRIMQVAQFGEGLQRREIPIIEPVGGHAIYIDAKRFLPPIPQSEYPAQALAVAAYIEGGIRGVEVGTVLADRDPRTGENRYPALEMVRLAIPRRTFSDNHLRYVAEVFEQLLRNRDQIRGLKITWEAPVLRHFTCQFELI
ncbi:MAG: tryptophanase [Deltaproteobacteria bacterium]|nr:tryptophanase [Deltaproteobacteria bacterium]